MIFDQLAPLVAPLIESHSGRRDLCIFTTRVVIEVCAYFGVRAEPLPVRVALYNATFAGHVEKGFADVAERSNPAAWGDDSWSVGIGYGKPARVDGWDGHLIATADGYFGDFSIRQAERPQHGIHTGPAVVLPYTGWPRWKVEEESTGTVIEYEQIFDECWRRAPDWRDEKRRRPVVGRLIRELRANGVK